MKMDYTPCPIKTFVNLNTPPSANTTGVVARAGMFIGPLESFLLGEKTIILWTRCNTALYSFSWFSLCKSIKRNTSIDAKFSKNDSADGKLIKHNSAFGYIAPLHQLLP
jgi:hypothetical protein